MRLFSISAAIFTYRFELFAVRRIRAPVVCQRRNDVRNLVVAVRTAGVVAEKQWNIFSYPTERSPPIFIISIMTTVESMLRNYDVTHLRHLTRAAVHLRRLVRSRRNGDYRRKEYYTVVTCVLPQIGYDIYRTVIFCSVNKTAS